MPGGDSEEAVEKTYAVRLAGSVSRRLVTEYTRQGERAGPETADRWRDAILDTVGSLATLSGRCVVAREDPLFVGSTVLQILHGRWRLLFTVHEADADDPPVVWVRHIRHGAEAPLTQWPPEDDAP